MTHQYTGRIRGARMVPQGPQRPFNEWTFAVLSWLEGEEIFKKAARMV